MKFTGVFKDGMIVPDGNPPLVEGAKVNIEIAEPFPAAPQKIPSIYERYKDVIGIAKGLPSDMAINHDHYIHGTPKVQE